MCEWLVYAFVCVSILAAILTIYQELQLKMVNLRAEISLPSEHRSVHRSFLQWILRQRPTLGGPAAAPSLRRVSISNRGNMIAAPFLSIFTKSRYDVHAQLWLYRLYLGISDGMSIARVLRGGHF